MTNASIFDFGFGNTTSDYMNLVGKNGNGNVCFTIRHNGTNQTISGTGALPIGKWTHVAVTLNGNTGILYIDGYEVGRNTNLTYKPSDMGNTTNNYIGKSQGSFPYFDGKIDDFRIYTNALLPAEMAALADANFITVNDDGAEITYNGAWIDQNSQGIGDYSDDVHKTQTNSNYVEYTFNGTGIAFLARKAPECGNIEVVLDGVSQGTFSLASDTTRISPAFCPFSKYGMTSGSHTIRIYNRSDVPMYVDAFLLYKN